MPSSIISLIVGGIILIVSTITKSFLVESFSVDVLQKIRIDEIKSNSVTG